MQTSAVGHRQRALAFITYHMWASHGPCAKSRENLPEKEIQALRDYTPMHSDTGAQWQRQNLGLALPDSKCQDLSYLFWE